MPAWASALRAACARSNPLSAKNNTETCSSLVAASITDEPDMFSMPITEAARMSVSNMAMAMLAAPRWRAGNGGRFIIWGGFSTLCGYAGCSRCCCV